MLKLFLTVLLLINNSWAEDFFKTIDFSAALGAQATSSLNKRGIITYGSFQAFPIYAVNLFNPNLMLAGSALYYKYQYNSNLVFRTRVNFDATNDDPLYETSEAKNKRVKREQTTEIDFYAEYIFSNHSYLRFNVSKDIAEAKGFFVDALARVSLFDPFVKGKYAELFDIGLYIASGYGDKKHNRYLYGLGSNKSEMTYYEYGLSVTSPKAIEHFWPTLRIYQSKLLGNARLGSYVLEKEFTTVEALFAFKVF